MSDTSRCIFSQVSLVSFLVDFFFGNRQLFIDLLSLACVDISCNKATNKKRILIDISFAVISCHKNAYIVLT